MNLSEILAIESRINEIEEEVETVVTETAKDALYDELYRLEDRMHRIYGDKEEVHSMVDDYD